SCWSTMATLALRQEPRRKIAAPFGSYCESTACYHDRALSAAVTGRAGVAEDRNARPSRAVTMRLFRGTRASRVPTGALASWRLRVHAERQRSRGPLAFRESTEQRTRRPNERIRLTIGLT